MGSETWLNTLKTTKDLCGLLETSPRLSLKISVFRDMCRNVASLSYDEKYKVGSIIVTDDFRDIVAIGYNGNYKGGPNQRESNDVGLSGFLHAEENALIHMGMPYGLRHTTFMICTHKPCPMCAKRIVNAGITVVLYDNDYTALGDQTDRIFQDAGVVCLKLEC